MTHFRIGFLPLVDAVLPIVAHESGIAQKHGISIEMVKDPSWATVRDRLVYGQTDAAHLLAPLAIATSLGLDQTKTSTPLAAPFMLGLNGNAITVSPRVAALLAANRNSFADVKQTGTCCAIGSRPAAAIRKPMSKSLSCRHPSSPTL